jgi:hypothetical protein
MKIVLLLASALAPAAGAQPAEPPAQPAVPSGRVVHETDFFARFSPRTALDMIRQVPGFTLIEGSGRRGFAGAVGNVLVDGDRPIAKSQTLSDILQRIPAAQVVRIELLRGAEIAGDPSGQAVIANVVRTRAAGGGAWSVGYEIAQQHVPAPNGWLSWSGRIGATDYSLGANSYSLLRELPGSRDIVGSDGARIGSRADISPRTFHEIAINGEAGRTMLGGTNRLTGQLAHSHYHDDSVIRTFSAEGNRTEEESIPFAESRRTIEAGLDHERLFGGWDLTLSGLLTRERYRSDVSSTLAGPEGDVRSVFTQDVDRESGESILRTTLARELSARHRIEASVEGAINTLGQGLVRTLDIGFGPFPLPVPNSNLTVVEHRGEAEIVHGWRPGERWTIESSMAAEASRLSFTGAVDQSVSLSYLKPSIQVTRSLGGQSQLRARLHRDVSQLDFADFVSRASFSDDIIQGGNPDLVPETSWRAELTADLRFGTENALSLTLFRRWVSDTVDLVRLEVDGRSFDAPGNIGPARINGAQLSVRAALQPLIRGGVLTLDGTWMDADVVDPLTGEERTVSDFADTELKIEFRQDLPHHPFAWGARYTGKPELTFFRFDEIDRRRESPTLDLFAETTAVSGLKISATLVSLLGTPERRERTFFATDRNGGIDHVERTERYPGRWLIVSMSGTF